MQKHLIDLAQATSSLNADADAFIASCERKYHDKISDVVDFIVNNAGGTRVVLLSGPSASGKTTTSKILISKLAALGIPSITVSTDDFFVNRWENPKNPDGTYDFERVEATDLPLLKACVGELLEKGSAYFPQYDFISGTSIRNGRKVELAKNGIVIVEGIHALNPVITEDENMKGSVKLYVCVFSNFVDNGSIFLTARELRLTRRILRDCLTRGSEPAHSIKVWHHVLRGEDLFIKPYMGSADFVIDTTHAYEPFVYRDLILPKLHGILSEVPQDLAADYGKMTSLSPDVIPKDSLLNEFVVSFD